MDESAEVADGHAVVASEENENATILLAQDDVRDRMVAEDAVTCSWHRRTTARSSNFPRFRPKKG